MMELWSGNLSRFLREAGGGLLAGQIGSAFIDLHGTAASPAETESWRRSLLALANAIAPLKETDIGIVCEYHLQYSHRRIDAVLLGEGTGSRERAAIVELKQWPRADLWSEYSTNIRLGNKEELHPSEQAMNYRLTLEDTHSAFVESGMQGVSAAFCHDMTPSGSMPLRDARFNALLYKSPLFDRSQANSLCEWIGDHVGAGGGQQLLEVFKQGRFKPSPRLLDVLEQTINANHRWTLIDSQQIAYNAIWAEIKANLKIGVADTAADSTVPIVLIRGGPGTGKTVIAIRLLRDALREGLGAMHSTGGKAFTISMRSAFEEAKDLFAWNLSLRNAPAKGIDLLLVDEAHRLRATSDTRFTPAAERNQRSQFEELVNASRLTVFFVDDNQYVRPDEIGSTEVIRSEAARMRIPVKSYDLVEQFRCGGCEQYVGWVDHLLQFKEAAPRPWGERYKVRIVDSPGELESAVNAAAANGRTARLVAGFCWKWSNPPKSGKLVEDVQIEAWKRPWNRKAKEGKQYKPSEHPYTLWARTDEGMGQVGCIYSTQGFEFDVVGVIWGSDLVWRGGKWIAQREKSHDNPVKRRSADSLRLFRNAYRVLLTRGMKETLVLCLDPETREHLAEMLQFSHPRGVS